MSYSTPLFVVVNIDNNPERTVRPADRKKVCLVRDQNDFHSELAATVANSRRQRQAGGIGHVTDIVSQVDGFPIDNSPRGLEAMVNALAAINIRWKDLDRITDEMFFGFARLSPGGFLGGFLSESLLPSLLRSRL